MAHVERPLSPRHAMEPLAHTQTEGLDDDWFVGSRFIIRGSDLIWHYAPGAGVTASRRRLVIDDSAEPSHFDQVPAGGEKTCRGIYRFQNQELIICMADDGAPRPVEFATHAEDRCTLLRLKRNT